MHILLSKSKKKSLGKARSSLAPPYSPHSFSVMQPLVEASSPTTPTAQAVAPVLSPG